MIVTHYSVSDLLHYIGDTPGLISLLYDLDLLPEQLKPGTDEWSRMLLIAETWRNSHS